MTGFFSGTPSVISVICDRTFFSSFSDKRRLDAGYGSRFGVANDVGSKLMGTCLSSAAFYDIKTFSSPSVGSAATFDGKLYWCYWRLSGVKNI